MSRLEDWQVLIMYNGDLSFVFLVFYLAVQVFDLQQHQRLGTILLECRCEMFALHKATELNKLSV